VAGAQRGDYDGVASGDRGQRRHEAPVDEAAAKVGKLDGSKRDARVAQHLADGRAELGDRAADRRTAVRGRDLRPRRRRGPVATLQRLQAEQSAEDHISNSSRATRAATPRAPWRRRDPGGDGGKGRDPQVSTSICVQPAAHALALQQH
jgi:hypothetical protein